MTATLEFLDQQCSTRLMRAKLHMLMKFAC